jgi:hypothetical protein
LFNAGCGPAAKLSAPAKPLKTDNSPLNEAEVYIPYNPVKIDILPLTEFVYSTDVKKEEKLKVYVALSDSFDCQVKFPCIFRFELYEYVQRSACPKGKRITIWPDIDLTVPAENNALWRDFLRAYEFSLDLEHQAGQSFILQTTCICPNGRRLSADFIIKYAE